MSFNSVSSRLLLISLAGTTPIACNAQRDWAVHHDSSGFNINLPEGWTAKGGSGGRAVIRATDPRIFAVVQPVESDSASDAIGQVMGQLSEARVVQHREVSESPMEEVAKVSFSQDGTASQANVLCILSEGKGMVYLIGAPSDLFAAKRGVLIKALQSFSYGRPASSPGQASGELSFREWTDPNEGMFTTEIPNGWKVVGGAYRFGPVDMRQQVGLVSPGGQIKVQNGEASFSAFVTQGPSSRMRGLGDGQSYVVNGITYTVLHYFDGRDFSQQYVKLKLSKSMPGLQITGSKERPDIEGFVQSKIKGGQARASAGETDFTFNEGGQEREGACVVTTVQIGQPGPGMLWDAFPSFVTAPANEMATAWKVWQKLILSRKDEPDWASKQSRITQQFNDMVIRNHEATMQALHEQYIKASNQLDENFRGWDNTINGVEDVKDASGHAYEVEAGHPYYWGNGSGAVGTATGNAPGINFTPLEKY